MHKNQYNKERSERWGLAHNKEDSPMQRVLEILNTSFSVARCSRYDAPWFLLVNPENKDWVCGVSDYIVDLGNGTGFFAEIKIKRQLFRKTATGGITRYGSMISNYGCESAYLDKKPVYKNVNAFLELFEIPKQSFVFLFVQESIVYAISVAEIEELLNNGYNGEKICEYGEGYGQQCYLIPIDTMHKLGTDDMQYFKEHSADKLIYPVNYLKSNISAK